MYQNDFAVMNKSYRKDLEWSVVMHRSWQMTAKYLTPFYIIVPEADTAAFQEAFELDQSRGRIGTLPKVISEEELFSSTNTDVPAEFGGWHRQQMVKLCFSKSNIARNYITVDSRIIFTNRFDYKDLIDGDGQIRTAAHTTPKAAFFQNLRDVDDKGWLNGRLVHMGDVLGHICEVMDNYTDWTNAYISCTGIFDSQLAQELEHYAFSKNLNGYAGLLQICPYEFAWYGEFVFSKHKPRFNPCGPHLMKLVITEADVDTLADRQTINGRYGIMLQPPAADAILPEDCYLKFFHKLDGFGVWNG